MWNIDLSGIYLEDRVETGKFRKYDLNADGKTRQHNHRVKILKSCHMEGRHILHHNWKVEVDQ